MPTAADDIAGQVKIKNMESCIRIHKVLLHVIISVQSDTVLVRRTPDVSYSRGSPIPPRGEGLRSEVSVRLPSPGPGQLLDDPCLQTNVHHHIYSSHVNEHTSK